MRHCRILRVRATSLPSRRWTTRSRIAARTQKAVWIDDAARVYLGHRRLSIVDVARRPAADVDRGRRCSESSSTARSTTTATLRARAGALGTRFETDHSDTEVLLHAYRAWGPAISSTRLNGMWAFVLYDRGAAPSVSAAATASARSRSSTRCRTARFVFASELGALRAHPLTPARISSASLQKYFALRLSSPRPRHPGRACTSFPPGTR